MELEFQKTVGVSQQQVGASKHWSWSFQTKVGVSKSWNWSFQKQSWSFQKQVGVSKTWNWSFQNKVGVSKNKLEFGNGPVSDLWPIGLRKTKI